MTSSVTANDVITKATGGLRPFTPEKAGAAFAINFDGDRQREDT